MWNKDDPDTWRAPLLGTGLEYQEQKIQTGDLDLSAIQERINRKTEIPLGNENEEDVENEEDKSKQKSKGYGFIPQDLLIPPSARQNVYKQSIDLDRMQPVKGSLEPYLTEIERQRLAVEEASKYLPPAQQAALLANTLAQSQKATNEVTGQVLAADAASQYQTDAFNIQAGTKEDLLNIGYAEDYQNKTTAALGNQEKDMRMFFNDLNNRNRYNFEYIDRRNLLNQLTPQYNVSGASEIEYAGAPEFVNYLNQEENQLTQEKYEAMTPEQQNKYAEYIVKKQLYNSKNKG